MKKIKIHLLKLEMAPFAGIVCFEVFIRKFVKIPVLDKFAEWAYRVYCSIDDAYARALGYKDSSEFMQALLEQNAIYPDDPSERDAYEEDNEDKEDKEDKEDRSVN